MPHPGHYKYQKLEQKTRRILSHTNEKNIISHMYSTTDENEVI